MTRITIPGPLQGKGRPRFDRRSMHAYTPERTRAYEERIRMAWIASGGQKLDGPVSMRIVAMQALPSRATRAMREAAGRGEIWPIRKPDLDNIIKIALDALNGLAYADDTQVTRIDAIKAYAPAGQDSGLIIDIGGIASGYGLQKRAAAVDANHPQHGDGQGIPQHPAGTGADGPR